MVQNTDSIDKVVLALLLLNLSDGNRAWQSLYRSAPVGVSQRIV